MLKELNRYENLGTPNYFWELFIQLKTVENWTAKNVQEYFYNRIVDGRNIFDGCLPLAEAIGVLSMDPNGIIILNSSFVDSLKNRNYFCNKFLESIFLKLKTDEMFDGIFNSQHISYDIVYRSIQISNSAFRFKYGNFKQLMIDFEFLSPHPDKKINKFIIHSRHRRLFEKDILPLIKKRKIGIDELQKNLERKQLFGEEAEIFVLAFEKERLIGHNKAHAIQKISDYDVAAGYDIVSYNDVNSTELDRFIEVKSYVGSPNFYWSRNEIDTARIRQDRYFLYLVDRTKIDEGKFIPIIIQNPFETVLKDGVKWNMRPEKYFISLN